MALQLNRRGFLKKSAAFGTLTLAGCAGTASSRKPLVIPPPRRGPNEELRIACVGIKGQGRGHIFAHTHANHVRIVTLCDVDTRLFDERIKMVTDTGAATPKCEHDVRRVIDDKDVDCLSIATPNHWHALMTIWACQGGKDVYVEKPCSHNIFESQQLIEAARQYQRVVQHGTQNRGTPHFREAMKLLRDGIIGEVYMARGLCFKNRNSIGIKPDEPTPEGVYYDLWTGPAPLRPFNRNRFHYEWHWNWDYGNGDIGNQGVHEMDVGVWGLGKDRQLPVKISSMGGRYTYKDQGQTPNTQVATFQYDDGKMLIFEVRGRQTNKECNINIGNMFYGSKGYMTIHKGGYETVINGEPGPKFEMKEPNNRMNFPNFYETVRNRKLDDLYAPMSIGANSAIHVHLANISYRTGRMLQFNPKTQRVNNDAGANAMITRRYRAPYVVPKRV